MNIRQSGSNERTWNLAFWLVLAAALGIRLWGTWYGLPYSYFADEYHEVMRALELGMGRFNFERSSKGGIYLILFLEYGFYYVVLKLTGLVESAREFAEAFVRDPTMFYLLGRVTTACIGAATVALVFKLARRAYSLAAGVLAATLLAINDLHIDLSRLINVDVLMTLFATAALLFGVRLSADGRRGDYLLAAGFAALATTSKLPGVLVILPLLIAHGYYAARQRTRLVGWLSSPNLWLAALVFIVVLVATNPGIVSRLDYRWLFMSAPAEATNVADDALGVVVPLAARPNLYAYYFDVVRASMGWPLLVVSLLSVGYAIMRRTAADAMLVSYALLNFVIISSTTSETLYYPRYALPIIVALVVLSGRALADLSLRVKGNWRRSLPVLTAVLVASPVMNAAASAYSLAQVDTRTIAKEWFEANIPVGSKVAIEGLKIGPIKETVQLEETPDAVRERIRYWSDVERKQAEFLRLKLAVHPGGGYKLYFLRRGVIGTLDSYIDQGVEYFVIRPGSINEGRNPQVSGWYLLQQLRTDSRVRLEKRFEGDESERVSPTVEIYRVIAPGDQET